MKKMFKIILSYLLITFNTFVFASESKKENVLKIGALLPLSGELKSLGEDMLYAINLALHDIDNPKIKIYPKDSGSKKEKIIQACKEFRDQNIKVIIGPTDSEFFKELDNFNDLIFISLSNINSQQKKNIIMMGINLESQLIAIKKLIKKEKMKKTVILYPKNEFSKHVEENIKSANFTNTKLFSYSSDPKILTKQIEKLTNYKQRKTNLESRVKKLEGSEEPKDIRELNLLKQRYTLGKVNFDSLIIVDFGDGLKSVLTSLAYTDVSDKDILITTANQWFDEEVFKETSIKNFYFPSINLKNFQKFNKKFYEIYNYKPNEITILAYDIVGLIYYVWKNEKNINSPNNFNLNTDIKGKIGKFKISENKVTQKLLIYKIENGKFIENKF
tara:strand:- start:1626 stop:2789 length:1164 start_codon:yes stop_codon:yes gene_type:complete